MSTEELARQFEAKMTLQNGKADKKVSINETKQNLEEIDTSETSSEDQQSIKILNPEDISNKPDCIEMVQVVFEQRVRTFARL